MDTISNYDSQLSRLLARPIALTVLGLTALLSPGPLLSQAMASFSGRVLDQSGKLVPGASVSYARLLAHVSVVEHGHRRTEVAPNEPTAAGVLAAVDGTFSASGLPAGNYYICADPPTSNLESQCLWRGRLVVTLNASLKTSIPPITLNPGVRLHFQFSDPNSYLPAGTATNSLVVGVKAANGAFRAATLSSQSATTAEFVMTVPVDMPLRVWAGGKSLKFQYQDGRMLIPANQIPVVLTPGATDQTIMINVSR